MNVQNLDSQENIKVDFPVCIPRKASMTVRIAHPSNNLCHPPLPCMPDITFPGDGVSCVDPIISDEHQNNYRLVFCVPSLKLAVLKTFFAPHPQFCPSALHTPALSRLLSAPPDIPVTILERYHIVHLSLIFLKTNPPLVSLSSL